MSIAEDPKNTDTPKAAKRGRVKKTRLEKSKDFINATRQEPIIFQPNDMPELLSYEAKKMGWVEAEHTIVSYNGYDKQRDLLKHRLQELKLKMLDGRFHGSDIAIAQLTFPYEVEPGIFIDQIIVNGQHTLACMAATQTEQWVTVKKFKCDNLQQLACLFSQFDTPGGTRSQSQLANAYTDLFADRQGKWIKTDISQLASAIAYAENNFRDYRDLKWDDKANILGKEENRAVTDFMYEINMTNKRNADFKHMRRIGVTAALYLTFSKDPVMARSFWTSVKTGLELKAGSAEYALYNFLKNHQIGNSSAQKPVRDKDGKIKKQKGTNTHNVFKVCIRAWNSYRQGERVLKLHVPATLPEVQ